MRSGSRPPSGGKVEREQPVWRSSLLPSMLRRRVEDAELEIEVGITRTADQVFSPQDVEDLEREKLGMPPRVRRPR